MSTRGTQAEGPRGRRGAGLFLLVALCALLCSVCASAEASEAPGRLHLGSRTLTRCASSPLAYCGSLPVALDPAAQSSPDISIAFRWYPATEPGAGGSTRTVVPVEGGPGYPTIESVSWRTLTSPLNGYDSMYGPLLKHWNLLAVDNRGTGESAPLKCAALQHFAGATGTEAFRDAATGCAEKLNHTWKYADGSWVHASDLFSSAPAADDMAAVIKALELPKVDLYGDSYGSFFAQVFASHFPKLVRSVVLDSTYQAVGIGHPTGIDPLYRSTIESMPRDFDAACSRYAACADAAPGSSWARIGQLAERLRESPISGRVPGPSGEVVKVAMNLTGLVDIVSDAAEDTKIYQQLDAAARALLGDDDAAPLLRLYAQREHEDEGYFQLPVGEYSVELYVADACVDYPQLFDMDAPREQRETEFAGALASAPSSAFGPFTAAEWVTQNENTEAFSVCIGWPSPTVAEPPTSGQTPLFPSSLPVLVLGGELDTWTPPVDVSKVLKEVGGEARYIGVANSTHVVGEGDTECGGSLVQRFVARPSAIATLDESCARALPPIHTVGVYPSKLSGETPLQPSKDSAATVAELQLAAAGVQTAGDAIARLQAIEAKLDHGLAGGTVTVTRGGRLLTLASDRLVPGVAVSGTVRLGADIVARDGEAVSATFTVRATGMPAGTFTATWTTSGADARAHVEGTVGGQPVAGTMPAP